METVPTRKFIIDGGHPLGGIIEIRGSKNTALPLIAACLLVDEPIRLENIPEIDDVATMISLIQKLGAETIWDTQNHVLTVNARNLSSASPDGGLSRKLRGSILLAGALLGRLQTVSIPYPGGDTIGARPLTTHFHALEALGVSVKEEDEKITFDGTNMRGGEVLFDEPSVTATENAILAAVLTRGTTLLRLPALEPHVQELISFLQKMGADIRWDGLFHVRINGVTKLHGASHTINADELEVSGLSALAAATHSDLTFRGVSPQYLDAVFLQLKKMGVNYHILDNRTIKIDKPVLHYRGFRLQSGLYPKLGSDHLPPFAVLATQSEGATLIHDWLYEGRLRYILELQKMGANGTVLDPHRALIAGPTRLHGCDIEGLDIRSGMTLIIAALTAEGRSTITNIDHIDRGYEKIDERLRAAGAEIRRV